MSVDLDRQLKDYCRLIDEKQGVLSLDDILERTGDQQVIPNITPRRPDQQLSPRRKWIAAAAAALVVLIGAIGIRSLPATDGTPEPADQPTTTTWPGPLREDATSMGIDTMEEDDSGIGAWWSWEDPEDSAIPWVDITGVKADPGRWWIELAGWPAQGEAIPEDATISHGMVVETNGDGIADYILGIDAPGPDGPFHVWITDLATGETMEQTGPPYGAPFDFAHAPANKVVVGGVEVEYPPTVHLFPVGAAPPGAFTVRANRFYAWASLTVAGDVVAWDYTPDGSWLSVAESEQTTRPTAPEMELGARMLIIPVQNMSGETAELFVAHDTFPMDSLVGTAVPSTVGPGQTKEVTFTVPDGEWMIFVNPGRFAGPLIGAQDIPTDANGELPITIVIGQDGSASTQVPSDAGPGWIDH